MQLKAAIGNFFIEFSRLETQFVGMALRALSNDAVFVEHAEKLLDFEARLKLLERMAFVRAIPSGLMMDLEAALLRARKLHDVRQDVARSLAAIEAESVKPALAAVPTKVKPLKPRKADYAQLAQVATLAPAVDDVHHYTAEAVELQGVLRGIADKLERQLTVAAANG